MKNTILILAILFVLPSCKQNNNKNINKMSNLTSENYVETILKNIKHYDYEPVYYLRYAQNICYSEILVNNIPVNKNYKEIVDGGTIKINNYIFKTGVQKVTIRLYPATNSKDFDFDTLREETNMKVSISESDNINKSSKRKEITSYLTPTVNDVNENSTIQKFVAAGKNYYEATFTFEAKVPYAFNSLEKGQDLRKWNPEKLEQKVVDFYKKQWNILNEKKKDEYFSYVELKEKETCQSLFSTRADLEETLAEYLEPFTIKNYKLQPLENYKLKLYGDGRIVCLELNSNDPKMRGKSALWAKFDEGDGLIADFFKFYLYIPEGEDELVMIR